MTTYCKLRHRQSPSFPPFTLIQTHYSLKHILQVFISLMANNYMLERDALYLKPFLKQINPSNLSSSTMRARDMTEEENQTHSLSFPHFFPLLALWDEKKSSSFLITQHKRGKRWLQDHFKTTSLRQQMLQGHTAPQSFHSLSLCTPSFSDKSNNPVPLLWPTRDNKVTPYVQ